MLTISTCHECKKRSGIIAGQIYCTIDGRRMHDHVEADVCPLGKGTIVGNLPPLAAAPPSAASIPTTNAGCCD